MAKKKAGSLHYQEPAVEKCSIALSTRTGFPYYSALPFLTARSAGAANSSFRYSAHSLYVKFITVNKTQSFQALQAYTIKIP